MLTLLSELLLMPGSDRQAAERPLLDGEAVMARLGLEPGPMVGKAMRFLLELKRAEPDLSVEDTEARLDAWYADQG